jgi:hypothetical protein
MVWVDLHPTDTNLPLECSMALASRLEITCLSIEGSHRTRVGTFRSSSSRISSWGRAQASLKEIMTSVSITLKSTLSS